MKVVLFLLIVAFAPTSFAEATAFELKCVVYDRRCDASGAVVQEKYEMSGVMKSGVYLVSARTETKDGRFVLSGAGIVEVKGPQLPKSAITIYDKKTQTGAAAGRLLLGTSAAPESNIVYVYDTKSADDSESLFCHSLEGTCKIQ